MKRLVYSPKVWAYVNIGDRAGEGKNPVIDVSNYIVSGGVTRVLNATSTAELTLRNPNRVFTQRENPMFRPMDSITIYAMRAPGFPRQLFTGYLDRTPFYQLYPGTVTMTASCTLKRLHHTYFDPALPYMMNFLAAYGWVPTGNGMWVNPEQFQAQTSGGGPRKLYMLGDSLGVGTRSRISGRMTGWSVTDDVDGGLTSSKGYQILKDKSDIPKYVLIQLGTNDNDIELFKKNIDNIMKKLGKDRVVTWATVHKPNGAAYNRAIKNAKKKYPNLQVYDFDAEVQAGNITLSDGIHPESEQEYAKVASGAGNRIKEVYDSDSSGGAKDVQLTDAGFGGLLFGTLNHIGKWSSKSILIEELPSGVEKKVVEVFEAFQNDNEEAAEAFKTVLATIVKAGAASSGGDEDDGGDSGPSPELRGNKNAEKIFNYLRDRGYTAQQAAGATGSMWQESKWDPKATNPSSGAYGIAQWLGGRKNKLVAKANHDTLETQLKFMWEELTGSEGKAHSSMKNASSIDQASDIWTLEYERPGVHERVLEVRRSWAHKVYNEFANKNPNASNSTTDDDSGSTSNTTSSNQSSGKRVNPLPKQYMGGDKSYGESRAGRAPGYRHAGEDYPAPRGTPVYAVSDGIVHHEENAGGYGTYIDLDHGDGTWSRYAHLSKRVIEDGKRVTAGIKIGEVGNTGLSSGDHLHFEIRRGQTFSHAGTVDPDAWLTGAVSAPPGGAQRLPLNVTQNMTTVGTAGQRSDKPKLIVLHSTESHNREGKSDLNSLKSILESKELSVHVGNDAEGQSMRYVPDDVVAQHVEGYNDVSLGIEQIGFAKQTKEEWPEDQLENTARWIAYWSEKHDIPIVESKTHGVARHGDLNPDTRTDPGEGYPFESVLERAKEIKGNVEDMEGDSSESDGISTVAAAFAAQFALPSLLDSAESLLLQGQKSLLNDQPLFPFIEQLCQASLRSFQSLPDGRFFAFYPDYFGEFGGNGGQDLPYWEILDTEILDGNIELTDENLVTHQYVVGDTIPNGIIDIGDRLMSSGTVTIFNIFDAGSKVETPLVMNLEKGSGREVALRFLEKYGARPRYEEVPFIRSPYFELLLAYQKFLINWSAQYLTNFTFTFMPELYPGGKLGFRDHGIKAYIESVTHTFDYEAGFTTSAVISAPSTYGSEHGKMGQGLLAGHLVREA